MMFYDLRCQSVINLKNKTFVWWACKSTANVHYFCVELRAMIPLRTNIVCQTRFKRTFLLSVSFIIIISHFKRTGIGVYNGRAKTKQGFDLIFGTNHLGTFLLTHLLMDLLKTSAPSHIINLTSAAHYFVWRNPFKDGELNTFAYPGSKMANIMHVRELSKRYKGTCIFTTLV